MYKVIIGGREIEFINEDEANEFYGENYKTTNNIRLYKDNKLISWKAKN